MAQSGRAAPLKQGWELTEVCCPSHRSDIAFVEPLILELDYAIETRGSDGIVASVHLITTCQPENRCSLPRDRKLTLKFFFAYSSGPSTAKSNSLPPSFAKCLNPAPGNQSGTCLTSGRIVNIFKSPGNWGTGRTYWERVDKEGTGNHDPVCMPHRVLCRLQELVFM